MDKFIKFNTIEEYEARNTQLNEVIFPVNFGFADNYSTPITDAEGKFWMILLPEHLDHFTQDEIDSAIDYEQIKLP